MINLAVFASGSGTNAQALIRHFNIQHSEAACIKLIISNKADAGIMGVAKQYAIQTHLIDRKEFYDTNNLLGVLRQNEIDLIVLAGFLWLLPEYLIDTYSEKIINLHPSLLPKFGGKGMFGIHVHRAVKEAGEKTSGITIHLVNGKYDEGEILFQVDCSIDFEDTVEQIAHKVQVLEHKHYPLVVENYIKEKFEI